MAHTSPARLSVRWATPCSGLAGAGADVVGTDTPYTVISDKDGNFTMTDIPPGEYTLKIWHEKLGESEQNMVVEAGGTTKTDVTLKL